MHPLLARLDRWLVVNRPAYYAALMPGAPADGIDELARAVGGELPPPLLRELLAWRNGQDESRNILYPSLEAWLETFVVALETGMFEEADEAYRPGCWDPVDEEAYRALVAGRYPGYPIEACVPDSSDDIRDESFPISSRNSTEKTRTCRGPGPAAYRSAGLRLG